MRFDRLGLEAGLAQLAANAIAQDTAGFLWIGTEEGLDRYDGYGFQHSRHDRANPRSLANDFIGDLEVDSSGALWVATDGGGVVRRDPLSGDFSALITAAGLERVRALRFDRTGRLWIGSRHAGVAVFEPKSQRLERFRHNAADPRTLSHDSIFALLADRRGVIWIGTEAGLDRLEPQSGAIQRQRLDGARIRALLEDRNGALWVGASTGLIRLDSATGARTWFKHDPARANTLPEGQINALLEDGHGHLWVGTDNGLALLDHKHGTFEIYKHDPADPHSLPDNQVMSLHADRTGLLWVGTKFGGLAKWNPRTWSFGHQLARNIMAFTEDRAGRLWIGSIGDGLVRLDRRNGKTQRIANLSDDRVMVLHTDRESAVWAGTMGGGLNRIDPNTLQITLYPHDPNNPNSLGAPGVMSLLEDSSGRLWVGTYGGGLSRYERATGRFARYAADPADPRKLASGRVTALAEDRNARIWVGTDGGGLHVFDPTNGEFFRLPHDARDPSTLSADTVYSLHVDARGDVWIGTRGGGLDRVLGSSLAPTTIRFRNYSESDGLSNNTIYGIRSDAAGMLWLSTNRGLTLLDPRAGTARVFHRDQGLQGDEFNFGAHYANPAGVLFFGGPGGYNVFKPERLEFNTAAPPVVLSSITHLGKPLPTPLRLDASNSAVIFEFAALDFAAPRANQFQYRLEGFDTRWSVPTSQRSVSYTNLDGGHYTLRVRAANADGIWNENDLAIPLDVSPPPWKSGWAYAGYVASFALLLGLAWLAHRRSIAREVRYSQQLEAEVRRRTLELEQVSLSDALTGLGNRRALIRAMPQVVAEARGRHMALMVLDLDNLKPINDEHGHEGGDRVLAGVSTILRDSVGQMDRVVRWGGDEFVIVKANVDLDAAAALAEHIRARLANERFALAGHGFARTSCSIGFALYPFVPAMPDMLNWEQVLNLADVALYRAKAQRNAWVGWSGRSAATKIHDLSAVLAADLDRTGEHHYVECRSSISSTAAARMNSAI